MTRGRGVARTIARAVTIGLVCGSATGTGAQSLNVQFGASSLMQATGGTVDAAVGRSTVSLSLGRLDQDVLLGVRMRTTLGRLHLTLGDEVEDFHLPTDSAGGARYVSLRGAGMAVRAHGGSVRAFAGATSSTTGASFFRGAKTNAPLGALFVDMPLRGRGHVTSKTLLAARPTSIHSVEWRAAEGVTAAVTAGVGSGRRYGAISGSLSRPVFDARGSYSLPSPGFRRIEVLTPLGSETEREGVQVSVHPGRWTASGSRQHLVDQSTDPRRALVQQVAASTSVGSLRVGIASFFSDRGNSKVTGHSATIGWHLRPSIDLGLDYYRTGSTGSRPANSGSVRVKAALGPRFALLHVLAADQGRVSSHLGGQLISNLLAADIGYQAASTPFGRQAFTQSFVADVKLFLPALVLSAATYITPDGSLRYTVSGSHVRALRQHTARAPVERMGRYLVAGRVENDSGQPIGGAALRIGDDPVLTDDGGRFMLRLARNRPVGITVVPEEFATAAMYEVVSAPSMVIPSPDDSRHDIVIQVRRR